ncbi:hypothetical protein CF95_gp161 [Erwinia phage PhiEaH1]|jgi:hypothetical protein|uniref:Uncharacterized protein n=1 Tax=Erwinia phage PhiEaH1 TaxID=1401669 RepID=W8D084_9CAUD|nr:hypothetical protein CF95_gp161 [Erwinia phage PhiEaH1]AGX01884.1 hypothetical protein [Erwinia phage PhiEaH1]
MARNETVPAPRTLPGTGDYDKAAPGEFDDVPLDRTRFEEDFSRIFGGDDVYRLGE